jgi:hypothetical protein
VGYYAAISGGLAPSSGVKNPKEKCFQLGVQNQAGNRGYFLTRNFVVHVCH